eukprot:12423462-Karenia_brevis.AAC.1
MLNIEHEIGQGIPRPGSSCRHSDEFTVLNSEPCMEVDICYDMEQVRVMNMFFQYAGLFK